MEGGLGGLVVGGGGGLVDVGGGGLVDVGGGVGGDLLHLAL